MEGVGLLGEQSPSQADVTQLAALDVLSSALTPSGSGLLGSLMPHGRFVQENQSDF